MTKRSARANGIIAVLGDRPVAYHPALGQAIGVKEAVFVCQLLYWDGKGKTPGGWIYKTQTEWTEETGLSRYEQETVRKHLIKSGLLEEKRAGMPARLFYRLNWQKLEAVALGAYPDRQIAETPQSSLQGNSDIDRDSPADIESGDGANLIAEMLQRSEITQRSPQNGTWQEVLQELQLQMPAYVYNRHLAHSCLLSLGDGTATIAVRDAEWVRAYKMDVVQRTLSAVLGRGVSVEVEEG